MSSRTEKLIQLGNLKGKSKKVNAYNKQYYVVGYDLLNSSVLSLSVKRASEGAVLTCSGKLFQACGAATENPQSPNLSLIRGSMMQ